MKKNITIIRGIKTKNGRVTCGKQSGYERAINDDSVTVLGRAYSKKGNSKTHLEKGFHEIFATIRYTDGRTYTWKKETIVEDDHTFINYYPNGLVLSDEEFSKFVERFNNVIARHN